LRWLFKLNRKVMSLEVDHLMAPEAEAQSIDDKVDSLLTSIRGNGKF